MSQEPVLNVERINRLMDARGIGPGDLAYLSGVAYDTIYKIRASERPRTSGEILGKLALALGCSVDYLLGLTSNPAPYSSDALPDIAELAVAVLSLSPSRRQELLLIAEALARAELADRERVRRKIEVNQRLLDMVRDVGGEEALDDLLTLLGEPAGLGRDRLLGLGDEQHSE